MSTVELHLGDCLEILPTLEAGSVHCVITSPPYWGLRDYGLPPSVWGGDAECEHRWGKWSEQHDRRKETKHGKTRTTDRFYGSESRRFNGNHQKHTAGQFCQLCGAWRGCLGLEPAPELYVEHLVSIFRQVRRVLRDDGTVWLVLGDSYASGKGTCFNPGGGASSFAQYRKVAGAHPLDRGNVSTLRESGLKPKDLVGIPWRVAFALQSDGWWLRSDIVWHKPNCMPESVRDRPTKAHEYMFLLSKSATYYYDADAIKETGSSPREWHQNTRGSDENWKAAGGAALRGAKGPSGFGATGSRNKRTVWTIPTKPYPEAHFATFPPALVEPCILAGCPVEGIVLDPFGGSGTVGAVALEWGRSAILIELSTAYLTLAKKRIAEARLQPRLEGFA